MDKRVVGSWTGSERERKEQGICLPPTRKAVQVPRFTVPAGTRCAVSKVERLRWRGHTTARDLGFEKYEMAVPGGLLEFRHEGWLIRVRSRDVVRRDGVLRRWKK